MNEARCHKCDKKFEIKEKPISFRHGRDIETAECPYCNHTIYTGKTSGTFEAIELPEIKLNRR